MADVMMMLGPYRFGLDTAAFQEMNRSTEWRWGSQDVFESRPVLQFTGWGEETLALPGVIFPEYWGGTRQLEQLRDLGDTGEPQTLIDGRGNVLGEWVITGVQEKQSVFAQGGVGRRQEFTVNLKRFGDSEQATLQTVAPAVASVTTTAQQAASLATAAGSAASKAMGVLTTAAANVQSLVGSVVTPLTGTINAVGSAISAAQTIKQVAGDTQQAIKALGNITDLSTAQSALNALMRAASNGAQVAARSSQIIGVTIGDMQAEGEIADAIATVRSAFIDVNRLASAASVVRAQAEDIVRKFT